MGGLTKFAVGRLDFDPCSGELRTRAETRRLEPRAAAVLQILCEHDGAVVTRQDLLDRCWGEGEGSDEALTQAIAQIRRALDDLGEPGLVETLAKRGYRLHGKSFSLAQETAVQSRSWQPRQLALPVAGLIAIVIAAAWVVDPHGPTHFVRHALGLGPPPTH